MPGEFQRTFRLYKRGLRKRSTADRFLRGTSWTIVPRALHRCYQGAGNRGFLNDVLWGQYCLFLYVRMRDDIFDGHVVGKRLQEIAENFLSEGLQAFARHFGSRSPFWKECRRLLRGSLRAIARVDKLQTRRSTLPPVLLRNYAKVSGIFKIGSAAVCIYANHRNHFRRVAQSLDEMAMAGHILDDAEDLDDDWKNKRINYAALVLLRHSPGRGTGNSYRRGEGRQLMFSAALMAGIIREAQRHLIRSKHALRGLILPEVEHFVGMQNRHLSQLSRSLEEAATQ